MGPFFYAAGQANPMELKIAISCFSHAPGLANIALTVICLLAILNQGSG